MYELYENKYTPTERENKQIQESCYRMGIPVDEYIRLVEENESLEEDFRTRKIMRYDGLGLIPFFIFKRLRLIYIKLNKISPPLTKRRKNGI